MQNSKVNLHYEISISQEKTNRTIQTDQSQAIYHKRYKVLHLLQSSVDLEDKQSENDFQLTISRGGVGQLKAKLVHLTFTTSRIKWQEWRSSKMSLDKRIGRIVRAELNSRSSGLSTSKFNISSTSKDEINQSRNEVLQSISRVRQYREELQSRYEKVKSGLVKWMKAAEERIQDQEMLKQELHKKNLYKEAVDLKAQLKEVDTTIDSLNKNLKTYNDLLS